MKKTNKILLSNLMAVLGLVAVGCSSGSSGPYTPGPVAPTSKALPPPAGFTAGTTVGSSPVLYNPSSGQLALPGASGYGIIQLPSDVTQALTVGNAYQTAQITSANNGSIIISLPTVTYQVTPSVQSASTAESFAIPLANVSSNIVNFPGASALSIPAGLIFGATDGHLTLQSSNGTSVTVTTYGCGQANGDKITTLTTATYNSIPFLAAGTNAGVVCILNTSNVSWNNMSTQASATGRYTAGTINGLGFYGSGSSLLGFWTVGSSNTVYQVNGSYNNSTYTGTAFWNMSTIGRQTNNSGTSSITVSGAPSTVTSTVTDTSGNLWAGSTNGMVYVLRVGSAGVWKSSQVATGVTGNTSVFTNGAAGATVTVAGSTTTYQVQ